MADHNDSDHCGEPEALGDILPRVLANISQQRADSPEAKTTRRDITRRRKGENV